MMTGLPMGSALTESVVMTPANSLPPYTFAAPTGAGMIELAIAVVCAVAAGILTHILTTRRGAAMTRVARRTGEVGRAA